MTTLTRNLRLDINQTAPVSTDIILTQGDSKVYVFDIRVYNGSQEINYDDVDCARIVFKRPDDTPVQGEMVRKEGLGYTYQLGTYESAVPGTVIVAVLLYGADNQRLSTSRFKVMVQPDILSDGVIESSTHFDALSRAVELLRQAQELLAAFPVTVTAGTTEMVPWGQPAEVTPSGTAQERVFNFKIPQGQPGVGDMEKEEYDPDNEGTAYAKTYNGLDSDSEQLALAAAQGKQINTRISQVVQEINEKVNDLTTDAIAAAVTGLLKGEGEDIVAALPGEDYAGPAKETTFTLYAASWTSYTDPLGNTYYQQAATVTGMTSEAKSIISLGNATIEQRNVCRAALLTPTNAANDTIHFIAQGTLPPVDLPMICLEVQ